MELELRLEKRLLGQVFRVRRGPRETEGVAVQRDVVRLDKVLDAPLTAGPLHAGTYLKDMSRRRKRYSRGDRARCSEISNYGAWPIHARTKGHSSQFDRKLEKPGISVRTARREGVPSLRGP